MQNGISPLIGEDGRAIQASIAHLPPDQQHQQLTAGAQSGLYPFSIAMALQAALKFAPPAQAPAPGTVVSDMIQQLAGGQPAGPQMPMPQGAPAQPSAGLASLPVSNIGTQAMASGGIVAFDGGGGVRGSDWLFGNQEPFVPYLRNPDGSRIEPTEPTEPTEPRAPDTYGMEDLYRSFFTLPPEMQGEMTRLQQLTATPVDEEKVKEKALKEFMSGDRGKALKTREEALTARETKNKERFGKEGRYARAAGFFEAAAEAGKPGTTLLGALSGGLGNMARANAAMSDKIETAQQALEDQKFAVQQAREELNAKGTEASQAAYDKELARYDTQRSQIMSMALAKQKMQAGLGSALIRAQGKGVKSPSEVYSPRIEAAQSAVDDARSRGDSADIAKAEQALEVVRNDYSKAKQAENSFDPKIKEENAMLARKQIGKDRTDISSSLGQAQEKYSRAQAKYNSAQTQANADALQQAAAGVRNEEALIWKLHGFDPAEIQRAAGAVPAASGGGPDLDNPPWAS